MAKTWWHWQFWFSTSVGNGIWVKSDSETAKAYLRASLVSLESRSNSCIVIHARMFASYTEISNLKGTTKSSAALFCKDLSNLTFFSLLLLRDGSGADGAAGSAEGDTGSSVGLVELYWFNYTFLDRVHNGDASANKTICSSLESVSELVEVLYSSVPREMIWYPKCFSIPFFFLEMIVYPHNFSIHCGNRYQVLSLQKVWTHIDYPYNYVRDHDLVWYFYLWQFSVELEGDHICGHLLLFLIYVEYSCFD